MSALEEGDDAFEVQVYDWDEHKLDHVSVIRTKRTVEDTRLRLLVLVKSPAYNDESTAPTDASTDIDDASLLREFSFGSLSLNDAGRDVVQSHYEHDNNDNATTNVDDAKQQSHSWRVHSFNQQSNIVDSIGESNGSSSLLDQNCDFQDKSLFDVDLDDDDPNVSNTSILGIQLANHDPSSSTTNQRSSKKQFRFDDISSSSKSLLLTGTRNTESYNFYRVSTYSQDNEEPLSCQQKLVQPALECDEDIWDSKQIQSSLKDTHRSGKHICDDDKDGIESFYGFICDSLCYGPTKQRGPWFIHLPYTLISSLAGDDE